MSGEMIGQCTSGHDGATIVVDHTSGKIIAVKCPVCEAQQAQCDEKLVRELRDLEVRIRAARAQPGGPVYAPSDWAYDRARKLMEAVGWTRSPTGPSLDDDSRMIAQAFDNVRESCAKIADMHVKHNDTDGALLDGTEAGSREQAIADAKEAMAREIAEDIRAGHQATPGAAYQAMAQALALIAQEANCRIEHGVAHRTAEHLQFFEDLARKALKENYDGWPGTGY
jgi:hypothetical protein